MRTRKQPQAQKNVNDQVTIVFLDMLLLVGTEAQQTVA